MTPRRRRTAWLAAIETEATPHARSALSVLLNGVTGALWVEAVTRFCQAWWPTVPAIDPAAATVLRQIQSMDSAALRRSSSASAGAGVATQVSPCGAGWECASKRVRSTCRNWVPSAIAWWMVTQRNARRDPVRPARTRSSRHNGRLRSSGVMSTRAAASRTASGI